MRKFWEQVAADIVAQFIVVLAATMSGAAALWEWILGRSPLEIVVLVLLAAVAITSVIRLFPASLKWWPAAQRGIVGEDARVPWGFVAATMVLGVAWFIWQPDKLTEKSQEAVTEQPQQVREYAYVRADTSTAIYPNGRAELYLTSTFGGVLGLVKIDVKPFASQGDRRHPEYDNENNIYRELPNVLRGGHLLLNNTLPAGHYFVQIDTSRDHFDQSLRLEWVKDELVQTTEVVERETRDLMLSTKGEGFGF